MFGWVEMNIIYMALQINIISYLMLPIAALPNTFFTMLDFTV